ncbi:MAG: hypothetical protein ABIJ45_01260 [Candidatus Zixiibacteriota bacterium]
MLNVKKYIKLIPRLVGLFVLFLIVLEIAARTDDYFTWDAPFFEDYTQERLGVTDSLGFHNKPNSRYEKWKINNYGYRGEDITREKPAGIIRILVVGASESFGLYESKNMEYPAQLQTILDSAQPGRYQVLNAASPGMSPPRITDYFDRYLKTFAPDIVVYYPSPIFYLEETAPKTNITITPYEPPKYKLSSRMLAKAKLVFKRILPDLWQTWMKQRIIDREIQSIPKDAIFEHPPEDHICLMYEHISDLVKTVQAYGARMILMTHGSLVSENMPEEYKQYLTGWRKIYSHVTENCFIEMEATSDSIVSQIGKEYNLELIDIASVIPKTTEYFADHVHFTDLGAEIMARSIANEILH